jgi:predicted O-methyltransferase YrrM
MYSPFKLAIKYLQYYFTAANGKGHGIHSPFVYEFIEKVLNDKKEYSCYSAIENCRNQLLKDSTIIDVEDFGAGSTVLQTKRRLVKHIAASSLKSKKYAQLLFKMAVYFKPINVVELGTSFGITTMYLAHAHKNATVHSFEGAKEIAYIAQENFKNHQVKNIQLHTGDFANTLPALLQQLQQVDFAFIDGNHRKEPTLVYFEQLLANAHEQTIFIFDDIHWSSEMEAAWQQIKSHEKVTLTIDLFFIGIVCINKGIKVTQHFTVRF